MPNKTIYVSDSDTPLFDEARELAGEALSSVITRALREFVSRHQKKDKGMKEVSVTVGRSHSGRVQRFVGAQAGEWQGMDANKEWLLSAKIYRTQKDNWAVALTQVCKASLLTNPARWKANGDYLDASGRTDLLIAAFSSELQEKLPPALYLVVADLEAQLENPVEYLDI